VLLSQDGVVTAGVSYFLTPRWLFAPYIRQPFLRISGRVTRGVVFESELEDGTVLSTHQLSYAPELPPSFVSQRLPETAGLPEAAAEHRSRLEALCAERGCAAKRIESPDAYLLFYRRAKSTLAAFHRQLFERRMGEKLRDAPFRDLIDPPR